VVFIASICKITTKEFIKRIACCVIRRKTRPNGHRRSQMNEVEWIQSEYVNDFQANGERVVLAKIANSKQHFRVYEHDGTWELRSSFGTIAGDTPLECVRKLQTQEK
jgi:hypothetical protein